MKRRRCSITKKEYYAAHDQRKKKLKTVDTNVLDKIICKSVLPNNASSSSSQNASILEATSVIPNEHAKPCTDLRSPRKKKRIDLFPNIGENGKRVNSELKEKVSGLLGSEKSNFKQLEKQSPVANELYDTKENLIEIGKKSELEEGEIWVDPNLTILIEETSSRRMKDLFEKQDNQHRQFKSFVKTEKLKIEHALQSESINLVHGKLCPQHPSCKETAFDQHFKSQKKMFSLSIIRDREKERELKEKWLKDANLGELVMLFDTIPLSCSEFEPEAFKEESCQGEITGCKQSNLNDAFKQCVPCRNTTGILRVHSFPHEVPSKTSCKSSAVTSSTLPNQAHAKEYSRSPVYDAVGNEEEERLPSQTLSSKHSIASSTGIVINSSGSILLFPSEKSDTPKIFANKPVVGSAILDRTIQSVSDKLVAPSNDSDLNVMSDQSTEHLPVIATTCSSNHDMPFVSDKLVVRQEEISLLQKVDVLGITEQNTFASNSMGSEQATNSLHKILVSSPVCQKQPIDSSPPFVVPMQKHVGTSSSIGSARKESRHILYSKSLVWHSSDDSPTLLTSARNQSTLTKSASLQHDSIREALTTVESQHGINSPHLLVHKPQSTEIVDSEALQCSNTDAFIDSTHVQVSPPFSTFLLERGQTNSYTTYKNEKGKKNAPMKQPIDNVPPIQHVPKLKERENTPYSKSCVQHPSDNSHILLQSTCNQCTSYKIQSLEHCPIRAVLATGENEQGPKSPKFIVHKMQSTEIVNSEVPLSRSTDADIYSIHAQSSSQIHEKLTNSELKQKIKRIKGAVIAMDKLPDRGLKLQISLKKLEEEQVRRQKLAMMSLEHSATRAVLARVENDQGPESPHLFVHKMQSTEIMNSEVPLCSSIGADVDSTHAQLSPSSSTFLIEQEHTETERAADDLTGSMDNQQGTPGLHSTPSILISSSLPMHELSPDPIQNELLRIQKEEDSAAQMHEKMIILRKTTFECELENLRKKYEASLKADEETYLAKKKSLAEIKNTLLRNKSLANSFPDFIESGTATNLASPTTWLSLSMTILQDTNGERASAQFAASLHNQNATALPSTVDASVQLPSSQSSETMMHDHPFPPPTNRNDSSNIRPISQTLQPNQMSTGRINIMQRRGSSTAPNGSQFRPV